VHSNKTLAETSAGSVLEDDLIRMREMHEEELERHKDEVMMALGEKDLALQNELKDIRRKFQESIEPVKRDSENLKTSLERLEFGECFLFIS